MWSGHCPDKFPFHVTLFVRVPLMDAKAFQMAHPPKGALASQAPGEVL
jgi:hypothetical protein